jgi:aryl sulfotransferase
MRRPPESDPKSVLLAQGHRRFIKTHSPADAIPLDDECCYITVHRDLRDVTMSWANHRAKMRPEVVEMLDELASGDDVTLLDPVWDGDLDGLLDELEAEFIIGDNLRSWWELRDRPNVLFVHFNDLLADLEGESRRIASFLDQPVNDAQWPGIIERCTIDHMRETARRSERLSVAFESGADNFFNRGTNGRWQGVLADAQLERLASMTSSLAPDAARWLQHGSLALGRRP